MQFQQLDCTFNKHTRKLAGYINEVKRIIGVGHDGHFYLHGGEVAGAVKLKHDLNITVGKALVGPADIVITRPYIVDVTVGKIIEATHAIRQLSKSFCHTTGGK